MKKKRVYIYAPNDRFNYGDLIFPYILHHYLKSIVDDIVFCSTTKADLTDLGGHEVIDFRVLYQIDTKEYDNYLREIYKIEQEHPEFVREDSPTHKIGGVILDKFEKGTEVTAELLKEAGIISKVCDGVKVLGRGEITKPLTVKAAKFTESAAGKIEAAGGKAEVI